MFKKNNDGFLIAVVYWGKWSASRFYRCTPWL